MNVVPSIKYQDGQGKARGDDDYLSKEAAARNSLLRRSNGRASLSRSSEGSSQVAVAHQNALEQHSTSQVGLLSRAGSSTWVLRLSVLVAGFVWALSHLVLGLLICVRLYKRALERYTRETRALAIRVSFLYQCHLQSFTIKCENFVG